MSSNGAQDELLMIPGPVAVSPAVLEAYSTPPPGHLTPRVIEAHGSALERMRAVWCAGADSQPFVVPGSGTIAMEMAVTNLVEAGTRVLVVDTGYFSVRMAEMLRRRGAQLEVVGAPAFGETVAAEEVARALDAAPYAAVFATHVDTSTGVRVDAEGIARAAAARGVLSVFDGVCATGGERFEQEAWGADVYLTSSQKALGLPAGLALMVVSPRALAAREALSSAPPMSLDWLQWLPIMRAYEARGGAYFSTPATNLVMALDVSLGELLASECNGQRGIAARFELHVRAARAMREAFAALGLSLVPTAPGHMANTLSAVRYPDGTDAGLVKRMAAHRVLVAGGLAPGHQGTYFRVGHMGWTVTQPALLLRTLEALEEALAQGGHRGFERGAGVAAARVQLS